VTAGIDLGLVMAAKLAGEDVARKIQLMMEYAPEPPFAGSPITADPATVKALEASSDIADQIRAIDADAISRLRRDARLT
jgi:cyclohexyl-isocyanide hydratase